MATYTTMKQAGVALSVVLLGTVLSASEEQVPKTDDTPHIYMKVPGIVRGAAESKDMNACFPGTAESPRRDAGGPGASAVKRATFGTIQPENLRDRAKQDVAALQTSCFRVVFRETSRMKRPDKSRAIIYYGTSSSHNHTVKLAYYVENGELIRFSLWCASSISEAIMEQIFDQYVSGKITDAQWKSE